MSEATVRPVSSPLVERLINAGEIQRLTSGTPEDFVEAVRTLGYTSVFDIIREPREAFARKLLGVWNEADRRLAFQAYDNALCYAAQASLVYRQQRLSNGIAPRSAARSGIRSLVEVVPGYPKLFKENWETFCRSGALEAIDSPVAYLVDILRFAKAIETHGNDSKLTLSQRRPDIFAASDTQSSGLLIDQSTTFDPIPALEIANEVVSAKITQYLDSLPANERPAGSVEAWFGALRHPFLFPYVDGPEQIRLGLELSLGQLLYRGNLLPTPFSTVTHVTFDHAVGYAPIALTDLSRERQEVLLEEPDVGSSTAIKAYLGENYGLTVDTDDALELQQVRTFLKQTGLDGDGLDELLARGKHQPVTSSNYQTSTAIAGPADFGAVYVNNDGTNTDPLTISESADASDMAPLQLQGTTVQRFIRLSKMVRMRQWLDVPFADLDVLVTAAQQAEGVSGASSLTQATLRLLGAYRNFSRKYGIDAGSFAALFGDLVPYSVAGKRSLFDRTFNHPPLLGSPFVIDDESFGDSTGGAADPASERTMLQLCGGLGLSPDEREYGRAATYVQLAAGGGLKRSLAVVSAFHRLARNAQLFGLTTGDYFDLLEMLGGEGAAQVSASGTLAEAASMDRTALTGAMNAARTGHAAVLIKKGGKSFILVTGGGSGDKRSAELYDPLSGTWTSARSMQFPRTHHVAALLPSGKVLVAGGDTVGLGNSDNFTGGAELYDPESDTWVQVASLNHTRAYHSVVVLEGRVYVFGGQRDNSQAEDEFFDEGTGTWTETSPLGHVFRSGQAVLQADGKVIVNGGFDISGTALDSAHEYDPKTDTWKALSPMPKPRGGNRLLAVRYGATVTALDDANRSIIVAGGTDLDGNALASAEIVTIDPAWKASEKQAGLARPASLATPVTGDALDLLLRIDWIADWLKANKKTVANLRAMFGATPPTVEDNAAIEEIARRIHQGLPATRLTGESIMALDLPQSDDSSRPIDWGLVLDKVYDPATGLVTEPDIALGVPAEWQLLETITAALATFALDVEQKADIAARLADVIGAARRAQCGLLEAELSHDSGLSPDQVTLALVWSGTTPRLMLEPLIDTDEPTPDWLALLSTFKRHAKAFVDANLSAVALHTFLAKPAWFDAATTGEAAPVLSLSTYYLMHRYRAWLNTAAGSEDDVIRYLAVANTRPSGEGEATFQRRCADRLAPLLGWVVGDVLRASASLPGGVATSVNQIEWLLRVGEVSEEAGVPIPCALQLGTLNGTSSPDAWVDAGASVYSAARGRAGAVGTAGMDARLAESLRDALVSLYLTAVVPKEQELISLQLAYRLLTPNDLYEYLLLDTQVSQQVQTSRVASAIASVQQYINGILMGMEPGYATWQPPLDAVEGQVSEVAEWRDQKSQYPLWAANQQLRYFPELYINPELRLGKSTYFEELEQTINQNRIHIDTVREAVLAYLNKFEEVANLTIVNGYASSDDFANATYYFVGKSRGKNTYYWRKVDMSQRPAPVGSAHKGDTLNPSAWSDWQLIDLPVSEATVERTIRPVFFNERLYVTWVDWFATGLSAGEIPVDPEVRPPQVRVSTVYKEYDGSWSAPRIYLDKTVDPSIHRDAIHSFVFHDIHVLPGKMMVGMYTGATLSSDEAGHDDTYAMMWTARLDHSFDVEPAWPYDGTVGVVGEALGEDERYVRIAARQFALHLAERYIQFPITGTAIRLRRATDASGSPWDGGHNDAIEGVASAGRVTYESEVADTGIHGYVVVTCRLKSPVNSAIRRVESWKLTAQSVRMSVDVVTDRSSTFLDGSSVTFEVESGTGSISSFAYPSVPDHPNTWLYYQRNVHGAFKNGMNSLVGLEYEPNVAMLGYGRATFDGSAHIFVNTPTVDFDEGAIHTYKLGIFYTPNSIISASTAPSVQLLASTPASALVNLPVGTHVVFRIPVGDGLFPIDNKWSRTTDGGFQVAYGLVVYGKDGTSFEAYDLKYSTIWLEDYRASRPVAPKLGSQVDGTLGKAEYVDFRGSSIQFSDGSSTQHRPSIRMNTLFVRDLISRTNTALENLLSWDTQSLAEPAIPDGPLSAVMDFNGANGKYFWELFFHLPFSISHRFHTEQQFADSAKWLQFIFDPSYKGVPVGEDLPSSVRRPYWLVRPLDWVNDPEPELSEALRAPIDPDGQASAFPVHYRKAVYFLYIRNLMMRGDWAFRDLTPDSLNEAKLWYVRALDLMGPRPDVMQSDRWKPALLRDIVASRNEPLRELAEAMGDPGLADVSSWGSTVPALQSQPFTRDTFLRADDTDPNYFRVPFNRRLVELWDQLENRLDNLRHNRTIDGKPLQLPIFAPPLDPSALLASFAAGGTSRSAGRLGLTVVPHYRYQTMFARASAAVETLIQFGQLLLSYVERKEQAEFGELQQRQLWDISQFAIDLQMQMQDVEAANEKALLASKRIADNRKVFYENRLADGGVSSEEVAAAALHMTARALEGGAAAAFLTAYCLKAIPNVFGLANGGQDVEGPPEGIGKGIIGAASIAHGVAEALDRAAIYKRRNEEWTLQRDQAGLEFAQLDEQLNVLSAQRNSTRIQLRQAEVAREQAEQIYTFLSKRFSGSSLYGWLVSQLSTFYYQAYDTTLSLCLAAEACWQFELGDFSVRFVEPGKWKDAYRGLTVGEGLKLNLLKMDASYVSRHERHLVIGKTISVKALYEKKYGTEWGAKWEDDVEKGVLTFEVTKELLDNDYAGHTLRRIRRVGVSIPAVVGAYQDIRAILTQTGSTFDIPGAEPKANVRVSQQIVVSRGIDDDGMMMEPQTVDDRYLPFEGTGAISAWNLAFPNAEFDSRQKDLLGSLNDVIVHLTYSARLDGGMSRPALRLPQGRIGR